jgi:hypothetical protein
MVWIVRPSALGHVIGHPSPELDQVGPIVNRPADFGRKSMGGQSTESVAQITYALISLRLLVGARLD